MSLPIPPPPLAALLCFGTVVSLLPSQGGPPRFRYVGELDMARLDSRGRLRAAVVDPTTGHARPKGVSKGVPVWIASQEVHPGKEDVFQHHLPDVSILRPMQLNAKIRDDLGFATGIDKTRTALVLSRQNYLQRHPSLFEVSNIIGLVQGNEVYLGQLEMRWGRDGRTLHVMRTQQRAGPLLGNGFPSLILSEMVQTRTENHTDTARMARIALVFARTRRAPARVRVHLVGDLRHQRGGAIETRKIHVVSEFESSGAGVSIKVWTSAGERYSFLSWESAFQQKHEREWRSAGSGTVMGSHAWERPYQPYAPRPRGVRPIPVVMLLTLPSGWHKGGYRGARLRGAKPTIKSGRWSLTDKDFLLPGGMWQFDKKGELVVRTPLGALNSKQVRAFFKTMFAVAKDDAKESGNLRDCLEVILNWAADMPQRAGAGPGEKPPTISKLLSVK